MRSRTLSLITVALVGAALCLACASKPRPKRESVLIPPRVDLQRYGSLGLIHFSSNGTGETAELGDTATTHFMAVIQEAQPGIPILELGDAQQVLASVGHESMGPEAIRAIGSKHGVDAILVGELQIQRPRPSLSLNSLVRSMSASADIEGELKARMFLTRNGATIWTNAATGKRSVANLNLAQGIRGGVGVSDPNGVESQLVSSLVTTLAEDFQPHWETR